MTLGLYKVKWLFIYLFRTTYFNVYYSSSTHMFFMVENRSGYFRRRTAWIARSYLERLRKQACREPNLFRMSLSSPWVFPLTPPPSLLPCDNRTAFSKAAKICSTVTVTASLAGSFKYLIASSNVIVFLFNKEFCSTENITDADPRIRKDCPVPRHSPVLL